MERKQFLKNISLGASGIVLPVVAFSQTQSPEPLPIVLVKRICNSWAWTF